nr:RILP-like protein homolog [Leptinotarsa decemlineata]
MPRINYSFNFEKMEDMSDISGDVTVVDVYDIASDIGKECEKIIDIFGADAVTSLMPKVINALELLENLATKNERENSLLHELQAKISQLENDKLEKAEYRKKFERVSHILKTQVERLTNTSRELRRKHKSMQTQVRTLCDERADFLVQLQDQQRDISALRQRLGLAQKENEDLVKCDLTLPSNKAVYDLDDPNRPRFTTQELKDILHERNELKARVSDLEDELEIYRPKNKAETLKNLLPLMDKIETTCDNLVRPHKAPTPSPPRSESPPLDDDAPVQGPLPYEPDDAPWKKSESGIRKFFRKIFSESSGGGGFPKRSLSTLSKMALSSTSEPVPV